MTNQKIIIALIALCAVLLCTVVFLVFWYRRPQSSGSRGDATLREDTEAAAGSRSRATPSPLSLGSANASLEVLETPRAPVQRDPAGGSGANDRSLPMIGPEWRPVSVRRSGSKILSSAWENTLKLRSATVDRPRSAVVRQSSTSNRPKTPRALSFPTALPSPRYPPSPEASYSLTQHSSNHPLLPNISPTNDYRVNSPSGHIPPPRPASQPSPLYPPGPPIEVHPSSPSITAALPPSPPPSPSPSTSAVHSEAGFGMHQPPDDVSRPSTSGTHHTSRPSTGGTPHHSFSTHRASLRQGTIGTAISSSAPSIYSTLSGSTGRFSNLFFAPMAASPPHHSIIVEDMNDPAWGKRLSSSGF
ncbi:hypothetical protein FRB98_007776 [Tulasnella sp. 332]|nr:hypothetical protein FRB98_007776 [Tulasnella sp. 332]